MNEYTNRLLHRSIFLVEIKRRVLDDQSKVIDAQLQSALDEILIWAK